MTGPRNHPPGQMTEHRPAGIVTRVAAAAADLAIVIVAGGVMYVLAAGGRLVWSPTSFHWPEWPFLLTLVIEASIAIGYLTAGWAITGRTFGKTLLGLRVLSRRGRLLGWFRALIRAGFCVFFPLGLFWVIFSPSRQSLQDIVLRTMVIYDWRNSPDPPAADT